MRAAWKANAGLPLLSAGLAAGEPCDPQGAEIAKAFGPPAMLVAETHRLEARFRTAEAEGRSVTVVACDLYGNASKPSEAKVAQ